MFKEIGVFPISKRKKDAYKSGEVWGKWLEAYPFLFDQKSRQFLENQAKYGYGFVEFLAIIFLYNSTGYHGLQGSYGLSTEPEKNKIVQSIVSPETWDLIVNWGEHHSQPPDLFVYSPVTKDYFFCEVKGPGDRIRPTQTEYFQKLMAVSGKPVYVVRFTKSPLGD